MESGLSDFLQQIPAPLIGMSCLSAIVLIGVVAYIAWSRSKKRQGVAAGTSMGAGMGIGISAFSMPMSSDEPPLHDLPDLEQLTTTPPVSPAPAAGGMQRVQLSGGDAIDAVPVLTILRDVAEGGLLVKIGDKVYRNPPVDADAEFKRRFNMTMKELATGKRTTIETPPAAVAAAPAAPLEADAPDVRPITSESASVSAETAPRTVIPPTMPLPGDLPKFRMPDKIEVPPRRGRKAPPKEAIPEINIAAAIESYLQHKMSLTPAYAGRNIHVRQAAHGGVEIDVDGHIYEAVGDIEDVEVRAFMSATIEEWQSRQ